MDMELVKQTVIETKKAMKQAVELIDGIEKSDNPTPEMFLSLTKLMHAIVTFVMEINTGSDLDQPPS